MSISFSFDYNFKRYCTLLVLNSCVNDLDKLFMINFQWLLSSILATNMVFRALYAKAKYFHVSHSLLTLSIYFANLIFHIDRAMSKY